MIQLQEEPFEAFKSEPGWSLPSWGQAKRPFSDRLTRKGYAHVWRVNSAGHVDAGIAEYAFVKPTKKARAALSKHRKQQLRKYLKWWEQYMETKEATPQ